MPSLRVYLLGPPRLERDGETIELDRRKAMALLVYLAVTGERQRRDTLATLFWPDLDQSRGRGALRRDLAALNKALGGNWIEADRETVGLEHSPDFWLDVDRFYQLLQAGQTHNHPQNQPCAECLPLLAEAADLYRDDFLTGFSLRDTPEFDDWQLLESEQLHQALNSLLEQLVEGYIALGNFDRAIPYAQRWLSLDNMNEAAHRQLMRLYAHTGQRSAALRQYQDCARILEQELGISPDEETTRLYDQIRRGEIGPEGRDTPVVPQADQPGTPPAPGTIAPTVQTPSASPATETEPVEGPQSGMEPENEIRIVTVLCVGLGQPLELDQAVDPEESANQIQRLLDISGTAISRYGGQINRILGDAALVVFGLSQLHEDDPERAVRAALAIREAAHEQDLIISAGINTGSVYMRAGTAPSQSPVIMGPAINLAIALRAKARANQILIAETTRRQTDQTFKVTPLSLDMQDVAQQITAYAVAGVDQQPGSILEGHRARLVGRGEELAKLKAALMSLKEGEGRLVSVIGEAGIGKSRLVAEFKQSLIDREQGPLSPLWLTGSCQEMSQTASYWPFIDLFRDYFAWHPDDDKQARAGRIMVALQTLADQGHLTTEQMADIGPLLGNLLAVQFGNEWDERLSDTSPEQFQYQLSQGVQSFLAALAHQQPLILHLEDLHWADSLSLDLISLLMEVLPSAPMFLVCVYRPDDGSDHKSARLSNIASRKAAGRYTELWLNELSPQTSAQLLDGLLPGNVLSDQVKRLILDKAQGNPFFLEEIVFSLIDNGSIFQEGKVWRIREGIEPITVPESVQSVILSRVDRLERGQRQVLQHAAVIGRLFQQRILQRLMAEDLALDEHLQALEDHALIYQERRLPEIEYAFWHVLGQEAIYQTLPRSRQTEIHRHVAAAIEALYPNSLEKYYERLAYHYRRGDVPDKMIAYALKAGEKSRRAYLNGEAIAFFQQALVPIRQAEPDTYPQHWLLDALAGLGQIHHGIGEEQEAEPYFREAIELGRAMNLPVPQLVRLHFWLGDVLYWQSRFEAMIEIGKAGLGLLEKDSGSVEAALMNQTIAIGYRYSGNEEKFAQYTLNTARFIEQLPYSEELRPAYAHIFSHYNREKNMVRALHLLDVLEENGLRYQDKRALGEVQSKRGISIGNQGNLQQALQFHQQSLELYAKIGDSKHRSWELQNLGWVHLRLGNLDQAERYTLQGLESVQTVGANRPTSAAYRNLGIVYLCQGLWDKAEAMFRQAQQLSHDINEIGGGIWATTLLGQLYLARENKPQALSQFQMALDMVGPDIAPSLVMAKIWQWLLSGLESACQSQAEFEALCRQIQAAHPELEQLKLSQVSLEPLPSEEALAAASPASQNALTADGDWRQHDPFGDCQFHQNGSLEIEAPPGRDLWFVNRSAPRLTKPVSGDFTIQASCRAASPEKPGLGGLVLWQDEQTYLCLAWGEFGSSNVAFSGSLDNRDIAPGRGRLPVASEQITLRLSRKGRRVTAYCSPDGQTWYRVGQVSASLADPLQVGLYAIGEINRAIYRDLYPDGITVRFDDVQLW